MDPGAHHLHHRRDTHPRAKLREDRDRDRCPRLRQGADLLLVQVDGVDEQVIGAEEAVLLVDGDGPHARHVGAGHHRVRREGHALLPRPRVLLLPDRRLGVFGAATGDAEMEQVPWTREFAALEREYVLEVERLRALGEGTPGARVTREAVGETAAQARGTQGGDRRLGVPPRLQVVLPGVERCNA